MYEYEIKGSDHLKGKVRKIGKATAVIVNKDWLDEEVIVIKKAELEGMNKERCRDMIENSHIDNLSPDKRREIGRLHEQAESKLAYELGRNIAATKGATEAEFEKEIELRMKGLKKSLEEFGGLTCDEIERAVSSCSHKSELLEGFKFERRK